MQNGGLSHTRGPALLKPRTQTQHQNIIFKICFIFGKIRYLDTFLQEFVFKSNVIN